jgi:protein gp37
MSVQRETTFEHLLVMAHDAMSDVQCCPLESGDGDGPSFFDARVVTARKSHRCTECDETIAKGSKYEAASGKWDDMVSKGTPLRAPARMARGFAMSTTTGISWTDATWNPVRGCSRMSDGCRNCYAETMARRFAGEGQAYEGLITERGTWNGVVRMVPDHLTDPMRWREPRRIFVNSMSDLFHESLPDEQIAIIFGVMLLAAQHTYQVLTKRARRMREFFERWTVDACLEAAVRSPVTIPGARPWNRPAKREWFDTEAFPAPWIWLGVSVENQEAANERIPELCRTPAAVRFLSCEPLLESVVLPIVHVFGDHPTPQGIGWVIAGCESGPGARFCDVAWLRSLRDQCASIGVPFFLKQAVEDLGIAVTSQKIAEHRLSFGAGSKRKGKKLIELPYLDGVQHAAFPVSA